MGCPAAVMFCSFILIVDLQYKCTLVISSYDCECYTFQHGDRESFMRILDTCLNFSFHDHVMAISEWRIGKILSCSCN